MDIASLVRGSAPNMFEYWIGTYLGLKEKLCKAFAYCRHWKMTQLLSCFEARISAAAR